jgi:hypothetical protein
MGMCHNYQNFGMNIEILVYRFRIDPDRHALDADPYPAK